MSLQLLKKGLNVRRQGLFRCYRWSLLTKAQILACLRLASLNLVEEGTVKDVLHLKHACYQCSEAVVTKTDDIIANKQ